MKILRCLISWQHVPNLHSIRSEALALIATSLMKAKNTHNHLLNGLIVRGLDYRKKHDIKDLAKGTLS